MSPETRELIQALHQTACKQVLALTGGGAGAAGLLLSVPGGSRTVLETTIPYSERSFIDFLGKTPDQFSSATTARDMAQRATARAAWLAPGQPAIGLGCTASLISDRPKKGDHRAHVAAQSAAGLITYSIVLEKGARDRAGEEALIDTLVLNALAEAAGIEARLSVPLLAGESIAIERLPPDPLSTATWPEEKILCQDIDGRLAADLPRPEALIAGSFNPVHEGHWQLAAAAAAQGKIHVAFELSATNVDKPPLSAEGIRLRLAQFVWRAPVWVTRVPTFAAKATLFPGVVFVVGADTAARLVEARYYEDNPQRMHEALDHIRKQGCRFLVAGREDEQGRFVSLPDLTVPEAFKELFTPIPEAACRVAISSTALRKTAPRQPVDASPGSE
jgi:hypothetical protein